MCVGGGGPLLAAAARRRRFSVRGGRPRRRRWRRPADGGPVAGARRRRPRLLALPDGGGVRPASVCVRLACAVSRLGGACVWLCLWAAAHRGAGVALAAGFCRRAAARVGSGRLHALALVRLSPAGAGGGRLLAMVYGRRSLLAVLSGGCGRQRRRDAWCQLSQRAALGVGGEVALAVAVASGRLAALTGARLLALFCGGGRLWRRAAAVWPPGAARRRRGRRVAAVNGVGAALVAGSSGTRLLTLERGLAVGIGVGVRRVLPGVDVAFAFGVGGCRLPARAGGGGACWQLWRQAAVGMGGEVALPSDCAVGWPLVLAGGSRSPPTGTASGCWSWQRAAAYVWCGGGFRRRLWRRRGCWRWHRSSAWRRW